MKHLAAILASLALLSTACLHAQTTTTIAQDNFDGVSTVNLGGSTADVGGTWRATTKYKADGSVADNVGGIAILPFAPVEGNIYTLPTLLISVSTSLLPFRSKIDSGLTAEFFRG